MLHCLPGCGEPSSAPASRVIIISVDTLRADHLGHYGYSHGTSPNLDAFAREAIVFDEALASAPTTLPSMSTMLTGRLPFQIGVTEANHLHMPAEITTLAEIASQAGVVTGAVVSNSVLRKPPGSYGSIGISQGFDFYDDQIEGGRDGSERGAAATTDAAIEWLGRLDPARPAFFWVHYQDPHGPYTPPEEMVRPLPPRPEQEVPIGTDRWGLGQIPAYQVIDDQRRPSFYIDRYDAEIRYVDQEIGRLLEALRARGLYEDSLILFTSDHGESLGDHGYWFSHGEHLYGDLVRVPFVIRFPKGTRTPVATERGEYRRSDDLVGLVDVFATALEALGLPPTESPGVSLLGRAVETRRSLTQHLLNEDIFIHSPRPTWHAVSDGRYRLLGRQVDRQHLTLELFDTESDPGEGHDLARKLPDQVQRLRHQLKQAMQGRNGEDWPKGVWVGDLTEDQLERLRVLGYVD